METPRGLVLFSAFLLLVAGCASIVDGRRESVSFSSDPPGAQIIINGRMMGITPATLVLERSDYDNANVVFRKEGYQDQQATIQTSLNMWFWGNIILGGLYGSSTDAATGAMWKFSPNSYFVAMPPFQASEAEWDRFVSKRMVQRFILYRYDPLVSDLARGEGENLVSLLKMLAVPADQSATAVDRLRSQVSSTENPVAFANAVLNTF